MNTKLHCRLLIVVVRKHYAYVSLVWLQLFTTNLFLVATKLHVDAFGTDFWNWPGLMVAVNILVSPGGSTHMPAVLVSHQRNQLL